jgi:DNA-binding transcriptional LysR family regulator
MIDLRHLRYAIAVADAGHMTRAAETLGIQQPPLSQQIRALERLVGVSLFRRLPRGMELTEAGRGFVERARKVIADVDLAVEAARRTARGEEGGLSIGFTTSAAFHPFVSLAVRTLRQSSPSVTLKLEEGNTAELIAALKGHRIDAAFVRSPVGNADGIVIEPLLEEDMVVAVPSQHPLANQAEGGGGAQRIPLGRLAGETFILYRRPTGPGLYDKIIAACQSCGFSPIVGQEAPMLVSTLSLVAAGLGITIVPDSLARLETNGIAYLRLAIAPPLTAPLFLAYRDEPLEGVVAAFVRHVRGAAGELAGRHETTPV